MLPLPAIIQILKGLFFIVVLIFWIIHVVYRFGRTRWGLFRKHRHQFPANLKSDYNHKFVKIGDDVQLHYVEEGDKSKPLMIFIHGFPEFWYSWRFQIKHFAKTHHVVAIDQRGYGESDKPKGAENYTAKILADDLKELIEKLGHKKAVLIGHDWGGATAWFTTLTHPEIVEKLIVLNCPHPSAFARSMWKVKKQIVKSWHLLFFQVPWLPEITLGFDDYDSLEYAYRSEYSGLKNKDNFTDEDLQASKANFSKRGAFTPPLNYYRAAAGTTGDLRKIMLKKAHPPVLIIWGEDDPFIVPECAKLSGDRCRNAKVEYIPNCSHWVQQDQPEKVNELIADFVSTKDQ